MSRTSGLEALLDLPESLKLRYREQSARCPLPFIYEAMNITVQCESAYRSSINPRFLIELTLMKLSTLMSRLSGQPVLGGVQAAAQPSVQPSVQSSAQPFVQSSAVSSAVSSTVSSASSSREQAQDAPRTYSAPTPQAPDNSAVSREESRPAITEQSAAPDDAGNLTPQKPRRVRTGKSPALSLNSIIGQERHDDVQEVKSSGTEHVTDEELKAKWPELAALYASKPRLSSTLSSASIEVSEENGTRWVTFKVLNKAQKEWVETKLLHELEGKFKQITGASDIKLRVDIAPDEERPQVNYMPSEKLNDLMSRNDEVRSLVSDFGLDLK